MRITDTVFQDYLTCKLKAFLALKGESGTPSEYTAVLNEVPDCLVRLSAHRQQDFISWLGSHATGVFRPSG
jgi:hypothetical protein